MPIIQASILAGRTQEQKDAFFEGITRVTVDTLKVKPEQVRVILSEYPAEHWCIGGVTKAKLDKK
jgi:4-oxalocrotonate tautomerase